MSVEAMTWVLRDAPNLPSELVSTLMGYANHAGENGAGAYPSHDTIAKYTRKSVRQVRKDVARLALLGLMRLGDQRMVAHIRADRRPVVYDLPLELRQELDDLSSTTCRVVPGGTTGSPRPVPQGHHDLSHSSYKPSTKPTTKKPSSTSEPAAPPRADVEQLCRRLADHVEANGSKRPTITAKWRTEARLLLDRDHRDLQKTLNLIDWCQADTFWKTNVLSLPTFRKKYDQLRLKALEEHNAAKPKQPVRVLESGRLEATAENWGL